MARDCWRVYICPECDELYVYSGVCNNRNDGHSAYKILQPVIVVRRATKEDPLPELQQSEDVQSEGAGKSG